MKVIVQQIERKMFLCGTAEWTALRSEAKQFTTAFEAILFCIRAQARDIRLIGENERGEEVHLYPFGGDPVIKQQLKELRKKFRANRRLEAEQRVIRARMNALLVQQKERKKQIPFTENSKRS